MSNLRPLSIDELDALDASLDELTPEQLNRYAQAFGLPSTDDPKPPPLPPEEYAARAAAECSLHEFARQAWSAVEPDKQFIDGWHIRAICNHLEATLTGEITNLLVMVPPGCMKSLLTSVFLPTWSWISRPSFRWMFASYSPRLSIRDSMRCRQILQSTWYRQRWGDRFAMLGDQNEKVKFENSERGWRLATSVGGATTGEHPDAIVVDDPLKALDAHSDAARERVIEWWDGTITTRGAAHGSRRIVIMQRLHEQDLAGHLLETAADDWDVICLPMRFEADRMKATSLGWTDERTEPGELLWNPPYTEQTVSKLERTLGTEAAGQLQQRPAPKAGLMFHREWFEIVDAAPANPAARVRYWDKAGSSGAGKYTAGVRACIGQDGIVYVEDVQRDRLEPFARNKFIRQIAQLDAAATQNMTAQWVEQEPGSAGKFDALNTVRELAGIPCYTDKVTGSKEARARPLASYAQAGNVRLVRGAWNQEFLTELALFPRGTYSDQADGVSGAFDKLLNGASYAGGPDVLTSGEFAQDDLRPFSEEERQQLPDFWRQLSEDAQGSADDASDWSW